MISVLGDPDGRGKGEFVLVDQDKLELKGVWAEKGNEAKFGYDFWYQPYWDVMVSSEWAAPRSFKRGLIPDHISDRCMYVCPRC